MPKTTWKKWRVGLWLAIGIAILTAGAGVASDMSWRQFVALVCSCLLSGIVSYLAKSPLEDVEDGDIKETIRQFGNGPTPPPQP